MSKLIKNSAIYTFVLVLQNATSFFLLPLYTSYLSPTDYGITAVVSSIVGILTILFTLSLNGAANRYYFIYKNDNERLKKFWGSLFLITIINSLILGILFFVFRSILLEPFTIGIEFFPYLFLGLVSVSFNPAFLFFQSCIQATQNGKQFAIQNFLFFLVNLILTIIFVTVTKYGAMGVLLARAITNIIFFIVTLILFLPKISLTVHKDDLIVGFKYSLPLIPHSLFGWTYSTIDRLLINKIRTTSDVGLYNIGAQFGLLMNILTDSINKAYAPWFFEQLEQSSDGKNKIVQVSSFLIMFYSFVALGLSLFSPELISIMTTASFHQSWVSVPFIAFSCVFGGIYYVVCNSLFVKKTYLVPLVTLISAIVSIVLNIILIPSLGIIGAGVSGLASQLMTSIIVLIVSMKVESIKYKWSKMYFSTFLCFCVALISYVLIPWNFVGLIIKFSCLILVFVFFILMYKSEFIYLLNLIRVS